MTPPEHLLIGVSCANIIYSLLVIFKKKWFTYLKLFFVLGFAAILPDIDSFFGNYTSTDPYIGHRGMTHSFLGVAVLGLIVAIAVSLLSVIIRIIIGYWKFLVRYFKKRETGADSKEKIWKYIVVPFAPKYFFFLWLFAFIAGVSHIISDLPQPPSVWKGIPLFFPLKIDGNFVRNGGWNLIGWYDIKTLWVLIGAVALSAPLVILGRFFYSVRIKIISIPFLAIVILFNTGVFAWMTSYIGSSKYYGSRKWYASQMKIVNNLPEELKKVTLKGKTVFIALFRQVRSMR